MSQISHHILVSMLNKQKRHLVCSVHKTCWKTCFLLYPSTLLDSETKKIWLCGTSIIDNIWHSSTWGILLNSTRNQRPTFLQSAEKGEHRYGTNRSKVKQAKTGIHTILHNALYNRFKKTIKRYGTVFCASCHSLSWFSGKSLIFPCSQRIFPIPACFVSFLWIINCHYTALMHL